MVEPFDIFEVLPNEDLNWCGPAYTLPDAMAWIMKRGPGDYIIFSLNTGNKMAVRGPAAKEQCGEAGRLLALKLTCDSSGQ
jgi:hypothetical protein